MAPGIRGLQRTDRSEFNGHSKKVRQEGSQTRLIGAELDAEKVKELNYTQMVALLKVRDDDMRTEMVNSGEAQALSTRELKPG